MVELHIHGGAAVVAACMDALRCLVGRGDGGAGALDVRPAEPGEFAKRAWLAGGVRRGAGGRGADDPEDTGGGPSQVTMLCMLCARQTLHLSRTGALPRPPPPPAPTPPRCAVCAVQANWT
jgi:hypothetical protein